MLAESATGVVNDVVFDDGCSSCEIDNAIGDIVEGDEAGCACYFHFLTD